MPSAKKRNAVTAQKHPAFGGADRSAGFVTALARCAGIALRTASARKTDPLPSNRINLVGKCSSDFAWETDSEGRFTFVSPCGAVGYAAGQLGGQRAADFLLDSENAGALPQTFALPP